MFYVFVSAMWIIELLMWQVEEKMGIPLHFLDYYGGVNFAIDSVIFELDSPSCGVIVKRFQPLIIWNIVHGIFVIWCLTKFGIVIWRRFHCIWIQILQRSLQPNAALSRLRLIYKWIYSSLDWNPFYLKNF